MAWGREIISKATDKIFGGISAQNTNGQAFAELTRLYNLSRIKASGHVLDEYLEALDKAGVSRETFENRIRGHFEKVGE